MNTAEKLTAALGVPRSMQVIRRDGQFVAAVGRWRHEGARVNLCDLDTVQLVFNVSGGQRVELCRGNRTSSQVVRAGSAGIVSPGELTGVNIKGRADTVQIIISRKLIAASMNDGEGRADLRAAGVRALVALAQGAQEGRAAAEQIVGLVARELSRRAVVPSPGFLKGGLSPAARRRVGALMDERLRVDSCLPLTLGELARAAGLSIHHFGRVHRQTAGRTPHASVLARRLDLALGLLLQPRARVDHIAGQTGFSSPAHFVGAFRRHLGVTPGALRDAAQAA